MAHQQKDAPDTFAPEVLAALIEAIDVNDVVDAEAPVPSSVALEFPAERFAYGFRLSRQLWRERFDSRALSALAARARRGEPLGDEARRWFKQVRAAFKHLRFAFFLYDSEHRAPPILSLVTLEMGEWQDAVRVGSARAAGRHAAALQLLMSWPIERLLRRETGRMRATDSGGFRRFTLAEVSSLRPLLAAPTTGAHAFHAARKVVSRQASFHDDMRTLQPGRGGDEHRTMARWLATLNGMMGQFHDDLVTRNAAGTFRYDRDVFALPEPIRARLETLVALYLGTSSSNPPSAETVR